MLNLPIHQFFLLVNVTRFMCIGCAIMIESFVVDCLCYNAGTLPREALRRIMVPLRCSPSAKSGKVDT